jgi:hypothetical protein
MKMPIVGLILASLVMAGCAPALDAHDGTCEPRGSARGPCGVMRPSTAEGANLPPAVMQARVLTRRDVLREH